MKAAHGLLLLLGLLFLLTELPPSMGELVKPGLCPRATTGAIRPCTQRCESDEDCRGKKKCCLFACRVVCKDPV